MRIKVQKLHEDATIPTKATEFSAGYDMYAYVKDRRYGDMVFYGRAERIHTGIAIEIPNGYVGLLFGRSGLATKNGLRPANCVGVIDSDYRGEICMPMFNEGLDEQFFITHGMRIGQLVIVPLADIEGFDVVDKLSETGRGEGGFGSTGR